jgi:hypothetical protein
MRASLSLNELSHVLTFGPVRMFAVLGAENSQRVLLAITSETGVELPPDWFD